MLSYFVVDFNRIAFTIPYLGHPVTWYGIFFAGGFFLAFLMGRYIFKYHFLSHLNSEAEAKKTTQAFLDKVILFIILGTVVGARLGHVFFYEWSHYQKHLLDIFKVWEGGLASHGGAIGVFFATFLFFFLYRKKYPMSFLALLDGIVIPTALVGTFIRIGNFINQEILGKVTDLPWGVVFLHPMQEVEQVPLHPVQIYESISYVMIFVFLLFLWVKRGKKLGEGMIAGAFFVLVFGLRFFIEFLKLPQSDLLDERVLNMGQILSVPFIVGGIWMLVRSKLQPGLGSGAGS